MGTAVCKWRCISLQTVRARRISLQTGHILSGQFVNWTVHKRCSHLANSLQIGRVHSLQTGRFTNGVSQRVHSLQTVCVRLQTETVCKYGMLGLRSVCKAEWPCRAVCKSVAQFANEGQFATSLQTELTLRPVCKSSPVCLVTCGVDLSLSAPRRTFISGASASESRCVPFTATVRGRSGRAAGYRGTSPTRAAYT